MGSNEGVSSHTPLLHGKFFSAYATATATKFTKPCYMTLTLRLNHRYKLDYIPTKINKC